MRLRRHVHGVLARQTKAVDAFSAGCVLYYLESGGHPFGQFNDREHNIRKGRPCIARGTSLLDMLVHSLIRHKTEERCVLCSRATAACALTH